MAAEATVRPTSTQQGMLYGLAGLATAGSGVKMLHATHDWTTGIPSGLFIGGAAALVCAGTGLMLGAAGTVGTQRYLARKSRDANLPESAIAGQAKVEGRRLFKELAPLSAAGFAAMLSSGALARWSQGAWETSRWSPLAAIGSDVVGGLGIACLAWSAMALSRVKVLEGAQPTPRLKQPLEA